MAMFPVCCTRSLHSQIPLARRRITTKRGAQRARSCGCWVVDSECSTLLHRVHRECYV